MKKYGVIVIIFALLLSGIGAIVFFQTVCDLDKEKKDDAYILPEGVKSFKKTYSFSYPELVQNNGLTVVNVEQSDFHSTGDGRPVIPVNLTTLTLPFGTKILSVDYNYSTPEVITIPSMLSYGSCSVFTQEDPTIYQSSEMYPHDFVVYHTGGGLSGDDHKTMLNIRVYPVAYIPLEQLLLFTEQVEVKVLYKEPELPLLSDIHIYDFLIITPTTGLIFDDFINDCLYLESVSTSKSS